jgi:predicted ribosomally synthesized peptide with nif11-like leader
MSEEQLKVFWEAIQADTGLRQKLQGVTEPDAVAAIAKEAGFMITTEELQRAQAEISEEDLGGGVAGGAVPNGMSGGGVWFCWN